jgi:DNA-binding MarR family transcriptional regulator
MGDDAQEAMTARARSQEDDLLRVLVQMPEASQSELATALGWRLGDGNPYKSLVSRTLKKLEKAKLIKMERDGYSLTTAGEKACASLKPTSPAPSDG